VNARWAIVALLVVALSGCSKPSGNDTHVDCPSTSSAPASMAMEMPAASVPAGCPKPVLPPRVTLTGLAANVTLFHYATFTWSLENRSTAHAHAMLSEVHISSTSVPDDKLAGPATFGTLISDAKRQHQDLPKVFQGIVTVETAGTYYVRAYAEINGVNTWSPERRIMVDPVAPTGRQIAVTQGLGAFHGGLATEATTAALGDAIVLHNDDAIPHDFVISAPISKTITVAQMADSDPILLLVPTTYTVTVNNDVINQSVSIDVPHPEKPVVA
jgi:hypothetical protein